jgi:hypothetical protein
MGEYRIEMCSTAGTASARTAVPSATDPYVRPVDGLGGHGALEGPAGRLDREELELAVEHEKVARQDDRHPAQREGDGGRDIGVLAAGRGG